MIAKTDLRIGNYFMNQPGYYRTVVVLNNNMVQGENGKNKTYFGYAGIQGVPFTSDLLEKCGFVFNKSFGIWQDNYGVTLEFAGNACQFMQCVGSIYHCVGDPFTTLHELQNYYPLFGGKDLTINL